MTFYGHWRTRHYCKGCKRPVSHFTMMYSNGTCPSCGYKGEDAVTIMDCDEVSMRPIYHSLWRRLLCWPNEWRETT